MPLRVDQCCCGCTLRTGAVLIALYYIVGSLIILSLTTTGMYIVNHSNFNKTAEVVNSTDSTTLRGRGRGNYGDSPVAEYMAGVTAMFAFLMIYSVLSIMLNVMLLIGAHTENLRLIFMWIIAHVIYLVVTVLGLLTNLFMTLLNPDQRAGSVGTSLVNIVLTFYFLVVVGSYYQQLKDRMLSTSPHAPHVVVYIENTRKPEESSPPPPYSELYPPWQQQQQQPVPK
ncbi:uncharacterized protein [Periplaneta americana]|uniref:uncharacterized protein n=1 Tax=Periplaneta americana TaxID=6978 RepID=UPI0037E7FA85